MANLLNSAIYQSRVGTGAILKAEKRLSETVALSLVQFSEI